MSLVGNLEDLSLGDLLQIVSLSQKSGVLELSSDLGIAQIVFRSGLVHAAGLKGETPDLRGLLLASGLLDAARFDAVLAQAGASATNDIEGIARAAHLDPDAVEALVRQSAEEAIFAVFAWETGDFSFDAAKEHELDSAYARLRSGINPQFLAMEGMRLRDERSHRSASSPASPASAKAAPADERVRDGLDELFFGSEALEVDGESEGELDFDTELELAPPAAASGKSAESARAPEKTARAEPKANPENPGPSGKIERPIVVIDPESSALEWIKRAIGDRAGRVHVFQRAEQGLARIRQYLIRGEVPCVLIATSVAIDPLSGIHGLADFVRRLRAQAPRILILGLHEAAEADGPPAPGPFDRALVRPSRAQLRPGGARIPEALATELVRSLLEVVAAARP